MLRHLCRDIWRRVCWLSIAGALAASPADAMAADCPGESGGTSVVTAIHDGEILILEDGRTVRLAGMFTPKRAQDGPLAEARAAMENALRGLVLGKKIELRLSEKQRDRYGRLMAHAFVADGDERQWVQEKIIGDGLARVISSWDGRACVGALLASENGAREAKRGLWQSGYFTVRSAEAEPLLTGLARSYEIVEGQVRNVAEIRGRIYINFGQDWRRDFTAFVSEKGARLFEDPAAAVATSAAAAASSSGARSVDALDDAPADALGTTPRPKFDFAALKGQRVRVRGWIENFNGPSISVTHPEQIEILSTQVAMPQ